MPSWIVCGSLATVAVVLFYILVYNYYGSKWDHWVTRQRIKPNNVRAQQFQALESRRQGSMIDMGTIFVPTAFALLGVSVQPNFVSLRIPFAGAGLGLYIIWLFTTQLPTRLMNDVDIDMRIRAEGPQGATSLQRRLYGRGHGTSVIVVVRRNHWLIYA